MKWIVRVSFTVLIAVVAFVAYHIGSIDTENRWIDMPKEQFCSPEASTR